MKKPAWYKVIATGNIVQAIQYVGVNFYSCNVLASNRLHAGPNDELNLSAGSSELVVAKGDWIIRNADGELAIETELSFFNNYAAADERVTRTKEGVTIGEAETKDFVEKLLVAASVMAEEPTLLDWFAMCATEKDIQRNLSDHLQMRRTREEARYAFAEKMLKARQDRQLT